MIKHGLKCLFVVAAVLTVFGSARADDIKIGEINSYSGLPQFTEPYRKGWQLAVEEINAKGGVGGKKVTVISKDDGGKPADAVTAANELVSNLRKTAQSVSAVRFAAVGTRYGLMVVIAGANRS